MKSIRFWFGMIFGLVTLCLSAAPVLPDAVFASYPAVYAVGDRYQIIVPVKQETLMWCEVNGREYFDESNGILRSGSSTHRIAVPMKELDAAKHYTIRYREVRERLPYYPKIGDVNEVSFDFRPVTGDSIRIYHIADAHNRVDAPVAAAGYFGDKPDLLILNGDIPEDGGDIRNFATIHAIVGAVTRGEVPTVYSRGNHDMRRLHAEDLAEHTPTADGNSYYTFRLGPIWGLELDCGEDKADSSPEYGNTIACHAFRQRETEFLKQVIADADREYLAPGVKYRLVICHVPFSQVLNPPFDIEQDTYREWCRLLRENVHPQLLLAGHIHDLYVTRPGETRDHLGQPCPVVVGANPGPRMDQYTGAAVVLTPETIDVRFTDQDRKVIAQETLPLNP